MQTEMELLKEMGTAFNEFKEANNKRLDEVEKKGNADPLLDEKVNTINAEITSLEEKLADYAELKAQIEDLEAQVRRPHLGGGVEADQEIKNAKIFYATVRKQPLEEVVVDDGEMDAYHNYKKAFLMYLRRGDALPLDIKNALSVGSDPDGGYWVLPDTSGRMATLIFESSPIRQIASVQAIGTDTLTGFNDLDEDASGGWVGELAARPVTGTPQIGKWSIPVHEQYSSPKSSQHMLDDSFNNVEAWLEGKVASKLARVENTAFVSGDGVAKPRGILTYAHGIPSKATWSVIQQTPSGADGAFPAAPGGSDALIDMAFTMKGAYRQGANWLMARSSVAETRKLVDGQGNYLWQRDFEALQGARLLGFSIVEAEDMPVLATDSLSIAFGNFNEAYQIVDRQGIRILRDPFTDKPNVIFYSTKRVGGDVINFEAIKIMKFNTTV